MAMGVWKCSLAARTDNACALGEQDGKPQVLWSVVLGRRVGEPILADLDGDGHAEILVAAEDGRLYCLKGE